MAGHGTLTRAFAALLSLGAGLAFLALDPARTVRVDALLGALSAGLTVLAWSLAALGAGAALIRRAAPVLLEDGLGLLHAAVAGLLLWGIGGLGLAAMDALHRPGLVVLALLLALGWLDRPRLVWPRPGLGLIVAGFALLLPGLVAALAPPVDTDELYYHLALPVEMLDKGGLVGGMLRPDGNRPMALHLPYAALLAFGGDSAPRLLHLLLGGGVLAATFALGRRLLGPGAGEVAALLLVGSWSFAAELGLASNNLPAALAVLAALDAATRAEARALTLAAGTALAVKYTTAGPLAGVFLIAALPWRARVGAGLGALVLVSPWWIRNAVEGLHPLFPFAGWPALPEAELRFQYLEKYGAGRDWKAMLALPWNVVMTANPGTFRFLGRLNPAFLALAPAAVWAAIRLGPARRVAGAAAVGALFWAAGPHWLRYLLPALPLLALAAGAAVTTAPFAGRLPRAALLVAWLAGLPANLGPLLERTADRWEAATGMEAREEFLARTVDSWPAVAWCNEHLPPDARVALLFDWSNALIERPTLLGSVEDHVPTRYLLLREGERSLAALVEAGATHALVGRVNFLHKVFPFLDEATFMSQFRGTEELLDELLLREATLVFQQGRSRVYRLPVEGR